MSDAIKETAGASDANSYVGTTDALEYMANHWDSQGGTNPWETATTDQKRISVQMATRLLDEWVDWVGYKAADAQALRWPRAGVYDRDNYYIDNAIIPTFLKNATAELARIFLTQGDATGNPDTLGFSEMKVGPLEFKVDTADRDKYGAIPDSVRVMVEPYGSIRDRTGTGMFTVGRS